MSAVRLQLHLGEFGPVRVFGRTQVVFCSYRGGVESGAPGSVARFAPHAGSLTDQLVLGPLRRHLALMRDHYANPRSLDMQLKLAKLLLDESKATEVEMIFDSRLPPGKLPLADSTMTARTVELARWVPDPGKCDTIVLVYPDALGLTFGPLERCLIAEGATNIVILTGRRRLFPLSSRAIRSFRWRRLLASTRIGEWMAAIAILPVAAALALYDWLTSGSRARS